MAVKKGGLGRGLGSLLDDMETPVSVFSDSKKKAEKKDVKPEKKAEEKKYTKKATSTVEKLKKPVEKVEKEEKDASEQEFAEGIIYIPLDDIKPNSKQPRTKFNEEALEELAGSIRENGVIQPILVRSSGSAYELVAGERRWRAARKAGLKEIPAIVRNLTDRQNSLLALLENMQREDLNMIEEALGIQTLMADYGLSQEEAAKAVGKSRPYVANALRLLKLPEEVRAMVESGELSAGHAKAVAGLPTEDLQLSVAKKAAAEGWSVRKIESYTGDKKARPTKKRAKRDAAFAEVEEKLSQHIGTKVRISGSEVKGQIEIEYYSREELDRLIELLCDEYIQG